MAWEKILGESEDWREDELDLLKDLFSDQSHLDSFHFSELHAAYLGISGKLFGDILGCTKRSTIDEVAVSGRTTLSWAAQRGDCKAVKQLLERGANVNKPDVADKTPLHWSERANDSECMRLLLFNDADVEAKDSRGRTVLSYVASKKEDPSFLEILVGFKADIESEDDERWRPLHWAAHKDCPVTLSQLLDKGADTHATDKRNRSALHLAILRNCHKNIRILIEREACGKPGKSELGYTILHTAARYGDIETLTLLESAALGHIDIDERNKDGFTAMADAQWRRDENKQWADVSLQPRDEDTLKWYTAFETLVESIRKDQQKCFEEDDDDVRGGLFDDVSPGRIEISAKDEHEIWEEALEFADGSSDVDAPDQGRNGVAAPWPARLSTVPSQRRSSI